MDHVLGFALGWWIGNMLLGFAWDVYSYWKSIPIA